MKRFAQILSLLLIALMALSSLALAEEAGEAIEAPEAAEAPDNRLTTTGSVYLRSGAGTSNAAVGAVPEGTEVTYDESVTDDSGLTWYHVEYDGKQGWISGNFVSNGEETPVKYVHTTGNVYLRSGAGRDYESLGGITANTNLIWTETAQDERGVAWYHVTYKGTRGWVSSAYAKEGKAHVPVVTATGITNIRKDPSLEGELLGNMDKGKVAAYLGETKKDKRGVAWYKIKFEGITGWVSSMYTELK